MSLGRGGLGSSYFWHDFKVPEGGCALDVNLTMLDLILRHYITRYGRSVSSLGELHRGRLNRCPSKFPEGGGALNIRFLHLD